ncbi:hybrid sensor histidine kinase/response regulator [Cupriavidus metallidurans]|uniref:hybrid sensor histidine kinase/response regulator n=1 Tax=Cupriavidus metallidurans TaxID=119219 RepID=UPI00164526DD|nr:hybrid sensor histidine kinase/response regulator [Cupriavidus metallidurans]
MERLLASSPSSPLKTLRELDANLKRERRVFSMVIGLLVFAALYAAGFTALSVGSNALQQQWQQLKQAENESNELLLRRYSLLLGSRTLFGLGELGGLTRGTARPPEACSPTFEGLRDTPELRRVCDRAVQIFAPYGMQLPLMFVRLDGNAGFSHQIYARPEDGSLRADPGAAMRILVSAAFKQITADDANRSLSPADAVREVHWFRPPAALGFAPSLVLGAMLVQRNGLPDALIITAVDVRELPMPTVEDTDAALPTLIDPAGQPLTGPLSTATVLNLERQLAMKTEERFHYVSGVGWVLHQRPLALGFGHYLLSVTWQQYFALIRVPLLAIFFMTAALIALLLAMARYWNHRFLTRTYARAQRALEGELINHLLVHATPVGLCVVRQRDFAIVVANQIARNVLGLEDLATTLPDALCAALAPRLSSPALAPSADSPPIHQFVFSLESVVGDSMHLEITYAPAKLDGEDVLFCAINDMSGHYEAEQLLREAKHTSDEAAREKVRFFASMSHEIRTPLASLAGNLELVALGTLAPEQAARVQAMQASAMSLLQIVNDVLDFSKMDVSELRLSEEWSSVTDLLDRAVIAHAPLAVRQRLSFYLVMDRTIPAQLRFDRVRLGQIIDNLLSNAFKFTPSGKIVVRACWTNGELKISVADSGVGIDDDLKRRLFRPFTQGDDQRLTRAGGTGLGLSICARLCNLMRGRIELDSTLGVGTRITVTLPLQACATGTAGAEWTLTDQRVAILCRAIENQEWLTNLFDPKKNPPLLLSEHEHAQPQALGDYLLVTDEYAPHEVLKLWGSSNNVVWLRQNGPLVPVLREDGSAEVCLYSLSGIRAATQLLRAMPEATTDAPAGQAGKERPPGGRNYGSLTVLIAEDNLLNRGLLRDQLSTLGANVVEAADGNEALTKLDAGHVDILLTDINMPGMSGYELLEAARRRIPSLPVYAVSANVRPEDVAQGREQGFTDYLSKPVALAGLARVLDDVANPDQALRNESVVADKNGAGIVSASQATAAAIDTDLPRFPAMPAEYASMFVEQCHRDLAMLDSAVKSQSNKALESWAHGVSGTLSVLGPSMLYEACQELRATIADTESWNDNIESLARVIGEELAEMLERLEALST